MSKQLVRGALTQFVRRPVLIAPDYFGSSQEGTISEVTSENLMSDLRQLSAMSDEDLEAAQTREYAAVSAAYGYGDQAGVDKPFIFNSGTAIIPVHGALINRFNWTCSWATGYNFIRAQVQAAANDDDVQYIILDINSYGGMAHGCQETGDLIWELNAENGGKPIIAAVDAMCYSAAYWLASQADYLAVTPSGEVGSIGVVCTHFDFSKAMEQFGVKVTFIYSGNHKVDGNPLEPLSDNVKAALQADCDATYTTFVGAVARGRDLSEAIVRGTEAQTYRAEEALGLGLVDTVQNPSDALEAYCDEADDETTDGGDETGDTPATTQPDEESAMTTKVVTGKPPAGATEQGATVQAGATTVQGAAASTGPTAVDERARIQGITTHAEADGRTKLAQHLAFNTDMTVEAAAAVLAASPKEAAVPAPGATEKNHFKEAMDRGQHPNVGTGGSTEANGGNDGTGNGGEQTAASRILSTARRFSGVGKAPEQPTTH